MKISVIYDTESHTKSLRRFYSEVAWREVYTTFELYFEEMPVASADQILVQSESRVLRMVLSVEKGCMTHTRQSISYGSHTCLSFCVKCLLAQIFEKET